MRFGNPHLAGTALELLKEQSIVARQDEGLRNDVEMQIITTIVLISNRVSCFLQFAPILLDVPDHEVLACQFIVVRKMVEKLHLSKSVATLRVEDRLHRPHVRPVYVPFVCL